MVTSVKVSMQPENYVAAAALVALVLVLLLDPSAVDLRLARVLLDAERNRTAKLERELADARRQIARDQLFLSRCRPHQCPQFL